MTADNPFLFQWDRGICHVEFETPDLATPYTKYASCSQAFFISINFWKSGKPPQVRVMHLQVTFLYAEENSLSLRNKDANYSKFLTDRCRWLGSMPLRVQLNSSPFTHWWRRPVKTETYFYPTSALDRGETNAGPSAMHSIALWRNENLSGVAL